MQNYKLFLLRRIVPLIGLIVFLFFVRQHSYLLFHTTIELFTVLVEMAVFMFAWNTRKVMKNGYFLFIGTAFLFTGVFDLIHTLSYKGMGIFYGFDANLPTQLWLASRFLLSISLLIAPLFYSKKFNEKIIVVIYSLLTMFLLTSILYWKIFPVAFVENVGLTLFKRISEYVVIFIFLSALVILIRQRKRFDDKIYGLLIGAFALNVVSEIFFSIYLNVYDVFNMLGHFFRLVSYLAIYEAILHLGITRPFDLLFREMKQQDELKDEFMGIASHELKNPLTNIKIYAQFLQKELAQDGKKLEMAKKIETTVDRMTGMINGLLDLNQIEQGRMQFNKKEFRLDKTVNSIISDFNKIHGQKRVTGQFSEKIVLLGDEERITEVLVNLLSNAHKYSPKNKEIIVSVKKDDKKVVIGVQDFGRGIPKADLTKVFDKYFREKEVQVSVQGLGLGLYISKVIVEEHQGRIWVESEVNKGTIFFISLPTS